MVALPVLGGASYEHDAASVDDGLVCLSAERAHGVLAPQSRREPIVGPLVAARPQAAGGFVAGDPVGHEALRMSLARARVMEWSASVASRRERSLSPMVEVMRHHPRENT